jgi:hypothetical protein
MALCDPFALLVYLALATGLLSLIGSSLILLSIYRTRSNPQRSAGARNSVYRQHTKRQTSHMYHRILGMMSIYDIVYTLFSTTFASLFKPSHSLTDTNGHGTRFTCTVQGFFIQWGYGSYAYGAWLSVYYVLTIRYNLRETILERYVEPVIHSSVFLFYFGTALIASAIGLMNPGGLQQCWIVPYPFECAFDAEIPCERGANFKKAILWMILVPSCTSVFVILICLSVVALTVLERRNILRQQHNRLPQGTDRNTSSSFFSFNKTPHPIAAPPVPGTAVEARSAEAEQQRRTPQKAPPISPVERLANEAIGQCILSGITFVNSVFWTNLVFSFGLAGDIETMNKMWVSSVCLVRTQPPFQFRNSHHHCPFPNRSGDFSVLDKHNRRDVSPITGLFQFCPVYQTSLLRRSPRISYMYAMVGPVQGCLEPVVQETTKW